jgi:hypothetical protein
MPVGIVSFFGPEVAMHPKKFKNVVSMSADDRYWYFVRNVAEFEQLWMLEWPSGSSLAYERDDGTLVYPFWPEKEFAEAAAIEDWSTAKAVAVPLEQFMERWLPGMQRNGEDVGVFWVPPENLGIDVKPDVLLEDLREECAQYE